MEYYWIQSLTLKTFCPSFSGGVAECTHSPCGVCRGGSWCTQPSQAVDHTGTESETGSRKLDGFVRKYFCGFHGDIKFFSIF